MAASGHLGPLGLAIEGRERTSQGFFNSLLYEKKEAYRRNKVREYVVWRVLDGEIDGFELREGDYVLREPDANGIVKSSQFPGLRLNVPAILADDVDGVLAALGPASPG